MFSPGKFNELKIGSLLAYGQTFAGAVIALVYTPLVLTYLGTDGYGIYSAATAVVSYVALLNFGFSSSYVRFYYRCKVDCNEQELAKTNGFFLLLFLSIATLALLAGMFLSANARLIFADGMTAEELLTTRKTMAILTVGMAVDLGSSLFGAMLTAHEKFIFFKSINILKTIMCPMVIYVFLLLGYRIITMAVISVAFSLLVDLCFILYCLCKLKVKFDIRHPRKEQLIEITAFSSFIAISSIVDQINWSLDKVILGRYKGAGSIAVYSVASQINVIFMQASTAVSTIYIPRINRMVAERQAATVLTDLFIRIGRFQLLVLLPIFIGFIFLGKSFISIWLPTGYMDSYAIALLLIGPTIIPYIQNAGITIQTAQAKHRFRAILYTGMALFNLALSIILCPRYGGMGCAFATAISILIANGVIMNIYYRRVIKLDIARFWTSMSAFLFPATCMGVSGYLISQIIAISDYLTLVCCAMLMTIIFFSTAWLTALTPEEKKFVFNFLKKDKSNENNSA